MLQALREVKDRVDVTHVTYLNHKQSKAIYNVAQISTLRLIGIPQLATKPNLISRRVQILAQCVKLLIDSVYSAA